MGIMVDSLLWVMQVLYHPPYSRLLAYFEPWGHGLLGGFNTRIGLHQWIPSGFCIPGLGFRASMINIGLCGILPSGSTLWLTLYIRVPFRSHQNRVDHRRLPQFVFEQRTKSMAGPIFSHASINEQGALVMKTCGATHAKQSMFLNGRVS